MDGQLHEVRVPRELGAQVTLFKRHLERGVIEVLYSAGAYCAKDPETGVSTIRRLTETEVEEVAAQIRGAIAPGKLSPES